MLMVASSFVLVVLVVVAVVVGARASPAVLPSLWIPTF